MDLKEENVEAENIEKKNILGEKNILRSKTLDLKEKNLHFLNNLEKENINQALHKSYFINFLKFRCSSKEAGRHENQKSLLCFVLAFL